MRLAPDSKMVIQTETLEDFVKGMRKNAQMLDRGEYIPSYNGISFVEPAMMLSYFPARRVKLLDALARDGAMPVAELAALVGRAPVAVERDLVVLESLGTIRLRRSRKTDAPKIAEPVAAKYEILYTLGLPAQAPAKRRLKRAS